MRQLIVIFTFLFISTLYVSHSFNYNRTKQPLQTFITGKNKTSPKQSMTVMPADYGSPFMSHYQFGQTDIQIWAIAQDNGGAMILAHKQGIIIFNGSDWEQVKLPSVPKVLKPMENQNLILVGCENQYGYIQRNHMGVYEYHLLSNKTGVRGEISDIKITDSDIYFYGNETLVRHKRNDLKFDKSWPATADNVQNGIIQIENDIYINIQNKGLCKVNSDGKKIFIPKSQFFSQKQIAFSVPVSKKKVIVGILGNNLFTFDGNIIAEFTTPAKKYIFESILTDGIDLTDDNFAISTISGGCIILNKKSGKIVNIVDIKNGLPDNEIYSVGKDSQGGLWLSHGYGVSRVNYNLPIKDFNNYPGVEGNIIDVIVFNRKTYIATNQGVFYQDSIIKLKEVAKPKEKKSVFERWKERRKEKQKTEKDEEKIFSIDYVFKKIKNIDGKCKQLIKYKDVLLVASNNGLYEIKDKTSKIILKKDYINCILPSKSIGVIYIGTDKGITAIKRENNKWVEYSKVQPNGFNEPIYTIAEDDSRNLWVGNDVKVFCFELGKNMTAISTKVYDFGNEFPEKFSIVQIDNRIFFISATQNYWFNSNTNRIEVDNQLTNYGLPYLKYIASQQNITWLQNEKEWICISSQYKPGSITERSNGAISGKFQISLLGLFENIQNIYVDESKNLWIIDGKKGLYKILANNNLRTNDEDFKVFIQRIKNNKGKLVDLENIEIASEINALTFKISAPYYLKSTGTKYQYLINGVMNDWSEWNQNQEFIFYVQPGKYTVQVRAKNVVGEICSSQEYKIVVKYPVWKKTWFVISSIVAVILLVAIFIILLQKKRAQILQRDNKLLEAKVEERTIEIVKQKEQIESKNREITKSLNYASHIQTAFLPPTEVLKESLDSYFIFNRPRDIVSGDFYWVSKIEGKLLVAVADCTGHGVPGAFLSLIGVTFLNEITSKMKMLKAGLILDMLRERVIHSLNQDKDSTEMLEGMDLAMVIFDFSEMEIQYAGAYNSMYLIRKGELLEYKGDKMPVSLHAFRDKPFTNNNIKIIKGDVLYLFSDGFMDQFGGLTGRKFFGKNFRALLTEIHHHPMNEQCELLGEILDAWRGSLNQVDDILVVGLKV